MSVEPPIVVLDRKVCATRRQARDLIANRPDVSATLAVYLRCDRAEASRIPADIQKLYDESGIKPSTERGVEVMTPSFADEILKAWPRAQLVGASRDVQESFDLAAVSEGREDG